MTNKFTPHALKSTASGWQYRSKCLTTAAVNSLLALCATKPEGQISGAQPNSTTITLCY